jgi:hypothetical protein
MKQAVYTNPFNSRKEPPWPASDFLSMYWNGTTWTGIEEADLKLVTLPAAITSDPQGKIQSIFSGTLAIHARPIGYCFTDEVPTDLQFGVLRLHDAKVRWDEIETAQGIYDPVKLAKLDAWVNAANAAGRDIIYTVYGTPAWAAVGGATNAPPTNSSTLANWLTFLYNRYGMKITHYEGWNEPNVVNSFNGTMAQLVAHQKTIYQTLKALNPSIKVISPSWTFVSGVSATLGLSAFATAAFADSGNVGCYFDIWGYHFYAESNFLRFNRACVDSVKTAIAAGPAPLQSAEVWCTEVGVSRPNKRAVMEMVAVCLAKGIKRVVLYAWDNPGKGDMRIKNFVSTADLNAMNAQFAGATMQSLNTVKTVGTGTDNSTFGGQLGGTINGVGVLLT